MKNSKKSKGNDLLPRRRPRLGKFIILAVILHVVFAAVYLLFYERKPQEENEVRWPVEKKDSASQGKKMLYHRAAPSNTASLHTESRPMSPARSAVLQIDAHVDSPLNRPLRPSANPLSQSKMSAPERFYILKGAAPFKQSGKRAQIKAGKRANPGNMYLARLSERKPDRPAPRRPDRLPRPPVVVRAQSQNDTKRVTLPAPPIEHDTAVAASQRTAAMPAKLLVLEERPVASLPAYKSPMPVKNGMSKLGRMVFSEMVKRDAQLKVSERRMAVSSKIVSPQSADATLHQKTPRPVSFTPPVDTLYAQMKAVSTKAQIKRAQFGPQKPADLRGLQLASLSETRPFTMAARRPAEQPNGQLAAVWKPPTGLKRVPMSSEQGQPSALSGISRRSPATFAILTLPDKMPALSTQAHHPPVQFKEIALSEPKLSLRGLNREAELSLSRRAEPDGFRIVGFQQAGVSLKPKMTHTVSKVPAPALTDHIAEMVSHLIQPARKMSAGKKIGILSKNLTYRDLGTESELTKFLSGLVTGEIDKQEYVKSLSPADVSGTPPVRLEGEMWDYPDEIKLRLRIMEPKTGRTLKTSNLRIRREQLPENVKIRPPEGESLGVIQKVVSLYKRYFPDGGDFHLGVWPDKGMDAVYMDGDKLVVYIISEKNAYLHVDYYQVDGQVVHLLPNQEQIKLRMNLEQVNFVAGGKPVSIDDYGYDFIVEAPFGEEMLMVIATQERLEVPTEYMKEDAAVYLVRLAKSLRNQKSKGEMAASQIIMITKATGPGNN